MPHSVRNFLNVLSGGKWGGKKESIEGKSAPRAHTKEAFMESNDEDGDGIVSKEEFLAIREVSHNEKDLNNDGIVNGLSKLPVYFFSHYIFSFCIILTGRTDGATINEI